MRRCRARWTLDGANVLLDEGGQRRLAHAVFTVDTGVDQHVDVAGFFPGPRQAGPGGGIGEPPGRDLTPAVAGAGLRYGLFNACAHSGPLGFRSSGWRCRPGHRRRWTAASPGLPCVSAALPGTCAAPRTTSLTTCCRFPRG